jgi:CheY-like chemotaxis protein
LFNKEDVILVVDDSRDLRTYLTSILQPYVGKILEATDGQAAFKLARLHRPHLIISDVQMPNMDGYQLLQAVKSDADLRWTPVILLTARAGEGERVEGLLTGAEVRFTLLHIPLTGN